MITQLSLIELIEKIPKTISPMEHFQLNNLLSVFQSKISKSQATGLDGIRIGKFETEITENTEVIQRKIADRSYHFTPFKQRLLLRGADRPPRQICIPTVRDRLVLRCACQILHTTAPMCIGSSPHNLVNQVTKELRSKTSARVFIRIDVKDFFPTIRHDILEKELLKQNIDELTSWLCMSAVKAKIGVDSDYATVGVPQGLSISGALAGIYMLRFDKRQQNQPYSYYRYVDDILIICEENIATATLNRLRNSLSRIGLKAHALNTPGKTEITSTKNGIDFLGYKITHQKISVRKSSFRRMFKNLLKVITDFKYRKDIERTIFRLNLKITGCLVDGKRRGWMMFFSRTEDLNQLAHLDSFIKRELSRVNLPEDKKLQIKTFVKSYHEICFKIDRTAYIPDFDAYDLNQKSEVISILSRHTLIEVQTFDVDRIELLFSKLVSKEVHSLEQDVGNPS